MMIRTFHSKLNRKTLVFCLLPATVLAVYFFWVKLPLPALCCMVFMVFVVERLIHTFYVFADDGCLYIHQGRFSRVKKIPLTEIFFGIPERARHGDVDIVRRFAAVHHAFSGRGVLQIFQPEEK